MYICVCVCLSLFISLYTQSFTKCVKLCLSHIWTSFNSLSWKKHLTKLCKKWPLHVQYVLALLWEIWSDRLSCQCRIICILMTNMTGSVSKIVKHVVSHIVFTSLYVTCSKCLACRCWRHIANLTFNNQHNLDCSLIFDASSQSIDIWDLGMRWR